MADLSELHDAYQELYDDLNQAYWVATDIVSKDRINGLAQAIFEIISALNKADIEQRADEYKSLKDTIGKVNSKLDALKKDIDNIIQVIATATKIAGAIDKVVGIAAMVIK